MTTNLMSASSNLSNRPADEHFASWQDLRAAADRDDRNARTVVSPASNIEVVAADSGLAIVSKRAGSSFALNNHSAGEIARLAGASSGFVFDRLQPKVAAIALTDALSRTGEEIALHLGTITGSNGLHGGPVLRGITSPTYTRVSDSAIYAEVDRWLIGAGFKPALPTKNTDAQRNNIMGNNKPCLFRGLRDSFSFFMFEKTSEGAGGRPVRRGVMVENSEVGASSVWVRQFVFDEFCANFIIWNAREMVEFRAIHRGDAGRILRGVREQLRNATPEVMARELEILKLAAEVTFADNEETAVERLIKEFELSESMSKGAVMLAHANENRGVRPLSFAGVANGVTSMAKSARNADKLVELAGVGGDIYFAASKAGR